MKFYTFYQNNSFGYFEDEEGKVKEFVIIEANNAEEANNIAESVGIYFNGVEDNIDCECCGDRWHRVEDDDGTDTPQIYANKLEDSEFKSVIVHYKED